MQKSPTSFAPVLSDKESEVNATFVSWPRWFAKGVGGIVILYLALLAVQIALRAVFPWDLFTWAESPFMTNMLKMDLGQSLFGPPADGNSFFYSPGLEYLTFALLKPLGLHLDIRFCRLVNVAVGLLAGGLVGLIARRALNSIVPENRFPRLAWLGAGIAVLVVFKNFTADGTHPDNLVMLHTAGLFLLTLTAMQRQSFGLALATMVFAAVGVFAKQTLCVAFVGPALVFARFNPWGWRKWILLAIAGALASAAALVVLWHPENARFWTWEVLSHQKIHLTRFYWMIMDLLHADRAFLAALGLAAVAILWRTGTPGRQYLQMWIAIGLCSVAPGALAYAKHFGTWNNLIIFQLWLVILVWPAMGVWLNQRAPTTTGGGESRLNFLPGALLVVFVGLLLPTRFPASRAMYECCATVQAKVSADLDAGRRVLVAQGTMYQLRAGSREVPLDRVNSVVDIVAAGLGDRVGMIDRLRAHYYDRIYLVVEDWYGEAILAELYKHYSVTDVVKLDEPSGHSELCRFLPLMGPCKILSPRPDVPPETGKTPAGDR